MLTDQILATDVPIYTMNLQTFIKTYQLESSIFVE